MNNLAISIIDKPSIPKKMTKVQSLPVSHLRVKNLNVYIHGKHILKGINLIIPEKKITCIIGPSGCGKTTLLRSFNRLHDDS